MAETTVRELANIVGIPVDRLLTWLGESGLPHTEADQRLSDQENEGIYEIDTLSYRDADGAITFETVDGLTYTRDLWGGRRSNEIELWDKYHVAGDATDYVEPGTFEVLLGGRHNDYLSLGISQDVTIKGGYGDDTIRGSNGADSLLGQGNRI